MPPAEPNEEEPFRFVRSSETAPSRRTSRRKPELHKIVDL
jgi:hypothetical protein